ncbi:MAG: DUF58 domain-containing protein, partial [Leifsonia sp.]|nr:DUF58 domain-containing protein [Leifsonia sp.]
MTTVTRSQTELTNARARIVGEREGFLADAIVWVVRTSATAGRAIAVVARRVSAVVTALGWSMLVLAALALTAGYVWNWVEAVVAGWTALALLVVASGYLIGRTAYEVG